MALPDEGDLVWIDFSPQAGHEQAGHRPALVLTPRHYHLKSAYAVVCPITSNRRPHPYKVALPDGLAVSGMVLTDQVKSIDRQARNLRIAGRAPDEVLIEVRARLASLILPDMIE
jgi:mRNA interferase MazF